jgi:hypothetical protein
MGVCPECVKKVPARILEADGKVFLEKHCLEHGVSRAMVSSGVEWFRRSMHYAKPGQAPLAKRESGFSGCPDSCGSCREHRQHTCMPVVEITNECDLACPVCLKSNSKPFRLDLEEFSRVLDALFRYEGSVDVINLSGGEPTRHPGLGDMLRMAADRGVLQSSVSTNGLTLAEDASLRRVFRETGAIAALQFDGFRPETYAVLRGRDLAGMKRELVRMLEEEGVRYSLVATVARGVNDGEIPALSDFLFESRALSLMLQPVAFTGRWAGEDPDRYRMTISDVVDAMAGSRHAKPADFNPLPCSHFSCFALSYYVADEAGRYVSLKEFLGEAKLLDVICNRTLPGLDPEGLQAMRERLMELWSAGDAGTTGGRALERMARVLSEMDAPGFDRRKALDLGVGNMKAVYIHQFMDRHTMDLGRLVKCCHPYVRPDGTLIPMCAENVFRAGRS